MSKAFKKLCDIGSLDLRTGQAARADYHLFDMDLKTAGIEIELAPETYISIRDLQISQGEKILIQGPSGCGKTSLLHALGLLRTLHSGRILFDNQEPTESRESFRRKNFGFVFQRLSLIAHMTVAENILLDQVTSVDSKILKYLDLLDRADTLVGPLSLGEQQRVAIARALHKKPKILFADEPTSSLDRPSAEKIAQAFSQLAESTVIAVSHDERITDFFDRVLTWKELIK